MEREISFSFLFTILKKTWWKIAIFALAVMLVVAAYTHFLVPKKYASSVEFYILNINASQDNTNVQLLDAAAQLANDYMDIITSEYMMKMVVSEMEEKGYQNVTIEAVQQMIHYSNKAESSVFTLTVVHTNPQVAYDVACIITEIAPEAVTAMAKPESLTHESLGEKIYTFINYYNNNHAADGYEIDLTRKEVINMLREDFSGIYNKVNCIEPIDSPKLAKTHYTPNLISSTLLGGAIAVFAAYALFLIQALFEQSITSEEDLKRMVGRPVIGTIPRWEVSSKK